MDGGELGRVLSSRQCPRLRNLYLFVSVLVPICEVSISSESLQCLNCHSIGGKLEVTAPMLQEISVSLTHEACRVVAPKLDKIAWLGTYDPGRHQFVVAGPGRHLRSLSISHSVTTSSTRLVERFDTASELTFYLALEKGIAAYTTLLKEMHKLPICEILVVFVMTYHHANAVTPMMLYLLRRCKWIRKLKLMLSLCTPSEMLSCSTLDCPCHLPENYRLDDITFDSLEEIEFGCYTSSAEQMEFVELLLSRFNMVILKRVEFTVLSGPVSSEIMEFVQRICSMCPPSSKVRFNGKCWKP